MNINKHLGALLLLIVGMAIQPMNAQHTKTLHQSFEIDSATQIQLELFGEYEINYWEGNTILTETKVELSDASPNILKHFVKMGRYEVEMKSQPHAVHLKHKDYQRKPIYTQNGQAWEFIKLVVYIPDVFSTTDDKHFKITPELEAQAN